MPTSSAIDLGLPIVPLVEDPIMQGEFTTVYNALRKLQQTLDDAGITPGDAAPSSVLDVAHGGTGADTLTGLIRGNGTLPFSAGTAESGTGAVVLANGPTIVAPTVSSPSITGGTIASATINTSAINSATIDTSNITDPTISGAVISSSTQTTPILTGYTVATLPAGTVGMRAYVTDATAPTFLTAVVGGGAVVCPVFYNGAAWVAG